MYTIDDTPETALQMSSQESMEIFTWPEPSHDDTGYINGLDWYAQVVTTVDGLPRYVGQDWWIGSQR